MRASADEIYAIEILEAITRPQVQYLIEAVRQVKGRTAVNLIALIPVGGRENSLQTNASLDIGKSRLLNLLEHQGAKAVALARPIDIRMLVCHRRKHVQRAHPAWGECRVGQAGVLNIERRVAREDVTVLYFVEIARVVLGYVDTMMRKLDRSLQAEVHHERRARELLSRDLAIGPTTPQPIRHQT